MIGLRGTPNLDRKIETIMVFLFLVIYIRAYNTFMVMFRPTFKLLEC